MRKTPKKLSRIQSRPRDCSLEWPSDAGKFGHGWAPPTRESDRRQLRQVVPYVTNHIDVRRDQSKLPQWLFIRSRLEKFGLGIIT